MKLSDEIQTALDTGDSATKLALKRRLRDEWLPRIQALESLVESKKATEFNLCAACGYYDGTPCQRDDCPWNTD